MYRNDSHKLSTVVTFKGRDLVMPKGIDGGEMLAWASADELLALHLELASNAKAFWKDGFLLYTLWAMGDFCEMIPPRRRSRLYPYTRSGFYQFLHDHGSQISPEDGSRRIKVFRAYNRFGVTIIRMVEKASINKAVCRDTASGNHFQVHHAQKGALAAIRRCLARYPKGV